MRSERGSALHAELLIALSTRLAAAEQEGSLLEAVVGELSRAFQVQLCGVLRLRDGLLEIVTYRTGGGDMGGGWSQPANAGMAGRCLRERLPAVSGDVRREPDYRDKAPELGMISALVVPVFVDGRPWGVIDLESERLDAFGPEDARVVTAVAAQVGSALVRLGDVSAGDPLTAT